MATEAPLSERSIISATSSARTKRSPAPTSVSSVSAAVRLTVRMDERSPSSMASRQVIIFVVLAGKRGTSASFS